MRDLVVFTPLRFHKLRDRARILRALVEAQMMGKLKYPRDVALVRYGETAADNDGIQMDREDAQTALGLMGVLDGVSMHSAYSRSCDVTVLTCD